MDKQKIMDKQKDIAKCCVLTAKLMKWYAEIGTDDCYEVNTHLKEAMKTMSNNLTTNNQIKFGDWLMEQITKEES